MSPSSVNSLMTCGEQFRLTRVLRVPERPQWASIGGSAVHRMTEDADRALVSGGTFVGTWDQYWQEALDETMERNPSFDLSEYRSSGRKSKLWPDAESPEWWADHGPKFVQSWSNWLAASGLEIWEWPDLETGELTAGIEYEVMAELPGVETLYVKSVIDRILWNPTTGDLFIVDLKSGSMTPTWPRQMALNNLGFKQSIASPTEHGAKWAGFWSARKGGITGGVQGNWSDLSIYSDEWLWDQVRIAKSMRDQHLFLAQPSNLCTSACGVRPYCRAMGGDPSFFEQDATLTQEKDDK
jgi:hypothetical protein